MQIPEIKYDERSLDFSYAADLACHHNYLDIMEALIKSGMNVNGSCNHPLVYACSKGRFEIVKMLVDAGARPDGMFKSCICAAVSSCNGELTRYLLNLFKFDKIELSVARKLATWTGQPDIEGLLRRKGGTIQAPSRFRMDYFSNCGIELSLNTMIDNDDNYYMATDTRKIYGR